MFKKAIKNLKSQTNPLFYKASFAIEKIIPKGSVIDSFVYSGADLCIKLSQKDLFSAHTQLCRK